MYRRLKKGIRTVSWRNEKTFFSLFFIGLANFEANLDGIHQEIGQFQLSVEKNPCTSII